MATYYVSATTGADVNSGLSVGAALATIGAAENKATSAGDIVYIAPGTYRETVSHAYGGTAADRIYFIGDPDCHIFGNNIPQGIIRITVSDSDNKGSVTGRCIDSNGKDYLVWKNVHLDGTTSGVTAWNDINSGGYGVYCDSENDYMELINCHIQNIYYGARNVAYMLDCTMINVEYGIYSAKIVDRCAIFSTYIGAYFVDMLRNSVIVAYYGIYNCDYAVNCQAPFAVYPNYSTSAGDTIMDSVAGPASYYGFGSPSSNTSRQTEVSNSYCMGARYMSRYGHLHGYAFGFIGRQMWSSTSNEPYKGLSGDADMSTSGRLFPQAQQVLYSINDIRKIVQGLKPTMNSNALQGRTTTLNENVYNAPHGFTLNNHSKRNFVGAQLDILGTIRRNGIHNGTYMESSGSSNLITSARDIGAFELTDFTLTGSFSSSLPAVKVPLGSYGIPFFVSASTAFTASAEVKYIDGDSPELGAGGFRTILSLEPSHTNSTASIQTITVSDGGLIPSSSSALSMQFVTMDESETFKRLTVSASAQPVDREYVLYFMQSQSGSSSTIVSDFEVT